VEEVNGIENRGVTAVDIARPKKRIMKKKERTRDGGSRITRGGRSAGGGREFDYNSNWEEQRVK